MASFNLNGVTYNLYNWNNLNNHDCNNLQEVQYLGRATGGYYPESFATPLNNLMSALSNDSIPVGEREDVAFGLDAYLKSSRDMAEGYYRYLQRVEKDCNRLNRNCGDCGITRTSASRKRETAYDLWQNLSVRRAAIYSIKEALTAHQNDQISDEQLENEINYQRAVLRERIAMTDSSELDVKLKEITQKAVVYFIPVLLIVLFYALYKSFK